MSGNYLFKGLKWKNRRDGLTPFMILRNTGRTVENALKPGDKIRFKVKDEKYCVGYNGEPCPFTKKIKKGTQCFKCKQIDDRHACRKCVGERCMSELGKDYCFNNEFIVYLASFGDLVKVGVSSVKRVMTRLVEQGADHAAKVLKAGNGLEARKLESSIAKKFGLRTGVKSARKISLLNTKQGVQKIKELIPKIHSAHPGKKHGTRIINVDDQTVFPRVNRALNYDESVVSGELVSVKGSWVYFKAGGSVHGVNTKELKAHLLSFKEQETKPTVQATLV